MSLINQMLRDLDSRPDAGRGGAVRAVSRRRRTHLWLAGGLVILATVGITAAIVLDPHEPTQDVPGNPSDVAPSPTVSNDGGRETAVEEAVRVVGLEQVNTRDGQRLRLTFNGDSEYRRRAAASDRLVIETPAEPAPEIHQVLPPAVAGIERMVGDDGPPRLEVRLIGWRAGPLVAEESRDGGDRLLLTLEPVRSVEAESDRVVANGSEADGSEPDGERGTESAEPPTEESEAAEPETAAVEAESAGQSDGSSDAPAASETVSETANTDAPAEASMSRQRREPTPSERAAESWSAARDALDAGRAREAESALRRTLTHAPDHVPARTALTELLVEQGRLGDADQLLAEAATAEGLAPDDRGYFLRQRARLWMNTDDFDRAIELLEAAAPDPAGEPETASLLAGLYYRAGRHQSAVDGYEALLESPPRRSAWWMGLGLAREGVGEFSAAVIAYRRALEGDGLRPSVRDYLSERIRELDGRD